MTVGSVAARGYRASMVSTAFTYCGRNGTGICGSNANAIDESSGDVEFGGGGEGRVTTF